MADFMEVPRLRSSELEEDEVSPIKYCRET